MTDIWVCGTCHSINRQRNNKCYKCGSAQATAATGEMATHRQEQAIAVRTVARYRPARALLFAAAIFIVGLAAVSILAIVATLDVTSFFTKQLDLFEKTGVWDVDALDAKTTSVGWVAIIRLAIVVPALLFFAAWLSRVVANVPALGGGLPGTTPARAFINTLIPVVNLRTVPGTVQDVLYRLDPTAGGFFMVLIAWVGLVGSWVVAAVAGRYLTLRTTFDLANATSLEDAIAKARPLINAALVLDVVTGVLIALGSVVLIMVMVRIERRSQARDREIRAVAGV